MSNMQIWNKVKETDANAVKQSSQGGRNVSSINTVSVVKKATETFGPVGEGWGYTIIEERFDDAGPIFLDETKTGGNGAMVINGKVHTMLLEVWYKQGDEKHTVQNYGHTPYIYRSKFGFSVDDEYAKKTLTDGLKKALSFLGFNADIHLGLWDDRNYVDSISSIQAAESEADKNIERVKQQNEFGEWLVSEIEAINKLTTKTMVIKAVRMTEQSIKKNCISINLNPDKAIEKLKTETAQKIKELS
jgi:hypothetical protein